MEGERSLSFLRLEYIFVLSLVSQFIKQSINQSKRITLFYKHTFISRSPRIKLSDNHKNPIRSNMSVVSSQLGNVIILK